MARVETTPTALIVHVEGIDRVLALKTSITIPLEHVIGVDQDSTEASGIYHGLRLPGTNVPGIVTAGTFYK
jgi:hypothetical protein